MTDRRAHSRLELADPNFLVFWDAYPRRQARKDALKAWGQVQPDAETLMLMLAALEWQRVSDAWLKDDGAYIPLPASWLRGERWTDEPPRPQRMSERVRALADVSQIRLSRPLRGELS